MNGYETALTGQFEESHRLKYEILKQLRSIKFNENAENVEKE